MNILNINNDPETLILNKNKFKEIMKNRKYRKYIIVINFFLIILISVLIIILHLLFEIYIKKNSEIQILKNQLDNIYFTQPKQNQLKENQILNKTEKLDIIDAVYLYDKNFFRKNNMFSNEDKNRIEYNILYYTHAIEKGLCHFTPRKFGKKKIKPLIELLNKYKQYKDYENDFSFLNGINILREYKKLYKLNNWINEKEYIKVSKFLTKFENIKHIKTGAYIITKDEIENQYSINFKDFVKSRHSTRNFKNMSLKIEDIKEAIEMAKYTPSPCNRQYVKVHYYPGGKLKQNVLKYSIGKSGFYLDGVNTFIITFDVNGLNWSGERNQGYFNAGLFSMNLINSFHSLGIGTCLIQFANTVDEEEILKEINNIPPNERIAVILFAGYYADKSIVAYSQRKEYYHYLKLHEN